MTEADVAGLGLKPLPARRLNQKIAELKVASPQFISCLNSADQSLFIPFQLPIRTLRSSSLLKHWQ
jgi:hypothetical protein